MKRSFTERLKATVRHPGVRASLGDVRAPSGEVAHELESWWWHAKGEVVGEWVEEDPLSPGVGFPGVAPRRPEAESEGGEEADHGDAPWAESGDCRRR